MCKGRSSAPCLLKEKSKATEVQPGASPLPHDSDMHQRERERAPKHSAALQTSRSVAGSGSRNPYQVAAARTHWEARAAHRPRQLALPAAAGTRLPGAGGTPQDLGAHWAHWGRTPCCWRCRGLPRRRGVVVCACRRGALGRPAGTPPLRGLLLPVVPWAAGTGWRTPTACRGRGGGSMALRRVALRGATRRRRCAVGRLQGVPLGAPLCGGYPCGGGACPGAEGGWL